MSILKLYHGSPEIVRKPLYGVGKTYNDYGQGFYCTEHPALAREWACTENTDGYANQYLIETAGLHILNLSSDEFTILHWLALLMENRRFRISTPVMKRGTEWLRENFLVDLSPYDVVVGYRADDSYFSFARAFMNNEISLAQLSHAMRLGRLGEQFLLKSPKAFAAIRFQAFEVVDSTEYFPKRKGRDDMARAAFRAELEQDDLEGLYLRDILRGEVRPNDPRLR